MKLKHKLIGFLLKLYWRCLQPRTLGVRGIVLDGQGRIALVRHTYLEHYYLPGGSVDKGESFDAALRRELIEELSLSSLEITGIVGLYHSKREHKDDYVAVFVCRSTDPSKLKITDSIEIAEAGWFALDKLPADLSPATARRINEYKASAFSMGNW